MLDRRRPPRAAPRPNLRPIARVRNMLALVTVLAVLLAVTALFKRETCSCGGPGVPYGALAVAASVVAVATLAIYFTIGLSARRR